MKTYWIVAKDGTNEPFDDVAACKAAGVPEQGYYGSFALADKMRRALQCVTGTKLNVASWQGVHPVTAKNGAYLRTRQQKRSTA